MDQSGNEPLLSSHYVSGECFYIESDLVPLMEQCVLFLFRFLLQMYGVILYSLHVRRPCETRGFTSLKVLNDSRCPMCSRPCWSSIRLLLSDPHALLCPSLFFLFFYIPCWHKGAGHFNIRFLVLWGGQQALREKERERRKDRNENEKQESIKGKEWKKWELEYRDKRVTQSRVERTWEGWKVWITVGRRSLLSRCEVCWGARAPFARWRTSIPAAQNPK